MSQEKNSQMRAKPKKKEKRNTEGMIKVELKRNNQN
jgi:hypothetical protein